MHFSDVWSLPKRVLFRFGFVAGALFLFPAPFGYVPGTETVAEWLNKPWDWLVMWFAQDVLGLARPSTEPNGSGDTTFAWVSFLQLVIVSVLGAAIWSALDRRRTAYPRLAAGATIALRHYLGFIMLSYGFAKLTLSQFPAPTYMQLDLSYGELPPMSVLWRFMGASPTYTFFAGLAEAVAGALLLWRRTSTAGALVTIAVMTNVVMMNLCYDVPVKLFSMQLLLMGGLVAMPHLRRVIAAVLGHATAAVAPRERRSVRHERVRLAGKVALLGLMAYLLYKDVDASLAWRPVAGPLDGIWVADTFTVGGVERPPLLTDGERWHKLILAGKAGAIRPMTGKRQFLRVEITADTIGIGWREEKETWRYTRPDRDHLIVDGRWSGKDFHATFTREPEPIQRTRGFHWINEYPYNR